MATDYFVGEAYSDYRPPSASLLLNVRIADTMQSAPVPIAISEQQEAALLTAFGELAVTEVTPTIQIDFIYGFNPEHQTVPYSGSTGHLTSSLSRGIISTGTGSDGMARVESKRSLRYRSGQGSVYRWTAVYDVPDTGSYQLSGPGNNQCGYYFGYYPFQGSNEFGILHRRIGAVDIHALNITVASTTAETASVILNGASSSVALRANVGIAGTVRDIGWSNFDHAGVWGYETELTGSTIYFVRNRAEVLDGIFKFNATTASGSFSQIASGSAYIETFIPQSQWNLNKMDGTGLGGHTLNPLFGNVFQIKHQYLGYGAAEGAIESTETGKLVTVHRIQYAGTSTVPVIVDPTMKLNWITCNSGSTTSKSMMMVSGMAAVQGKVAVNTTPHGTRTSKTVTATPSVILSIMPETVHNGDVSNRSVRLNLASFATDGTKNVQFDIILSTIKANGFADHYAGKPTDPSYTNVKKSDSIVLRDFSSTTITDGGDRIITKILGKTESADLDLKDYNIVLEPGDVLSIVGTVLGAATSDVTVAISWTEDY